ncbi:tyrosine-protein kinase Dnt-like [Schistocerca gregaria]|uniref:tyrosine-protein kinase Dnt-like n=1 Tax=Schistocerca gregaria TaxID=7010 RepID=UPI00211E7443|nr:tyrosine-protein kinase Dnt-like [Schistocerca gregaria]
MALHAEASRGAAGRLRLASSLVCCFLLDLCSGNLNLYLSQPEVRRLLGLEAELFYVRDGMVNTYALNFVVPVHPGIESLHFTWQSLAGRPLPYEVSVWASDLEALWPPQLNISARGEVPTYAQTWRVTLPCTGRADAEVDVALSVNVTLHRATNNVTSLLFRRRKICRKGDPESQQPSVVVDAAAAVSEATPTLVFYVALGCACALIVIVLLAVAGCYLRTSKARRHGHILQESRHGSASSSAAGHASLLPPPPPPARATSAASSNSYASLRTSAGPLPAPGAAAQPPADIHERIAQLTIQRCRVRLRSVVLEGTFGRVYRGSYTHEDGVEEEVLVKTVTDHASQVQVSLLLQEGMAMYGFSHKNILSVLGVSIEDHTSPFLIYPYHGYTNLKRFLQKCKLCPEGVAHTLTTQEVVDMALQIVAAVQFLHKKRLVHRDLAARNCVVDERLHVQLTDCALSRDLFPADYHCLGDNENRPVKWLAIESLLHNSYSPASDVWAFGVLLWELTTLAQQPYAEIDPFEMAAYLSDGFRLVQPVNCPDELFGVMAYCWAMSPDERPTFSQLQVCLQDFYTQLTRYV